MAGLSSAFKLANLTKSLSSRLSKIKYSLSGLQLGSRITNWFGSLNWSGIAKGGFGAAIVGGVYTGWRSIVGSVSDVTGLSEDTTQDVLFILIALFIVWVVYKIFTTRKGRQVVNDFNDMRYHHNRASSSRPRSRSRSAGSSSSRSSSSRRSSGFSGSSGSSGGSGTIPAHRMDARRLNNPPTRQQAFGGSRRRRSS